MAFLVLALYQILHLIAGPSSFLSFKYFLDVTANPIGKWNDLGVFSGVAVLLSLISLELLALSRGFKILSYIVLVVGLFLLALTNFTVIWNTPITIVTIIGFFALVFFVYFISSNNAEIQTAEGTTLARSRKLPLPSLIVLVFAVIFTLAVTPLSNFFNNYFHINVTDVEPTWQSTLVVSKGALSHNALLGVGPNRFDSQWFLSKPDGVNQTDFWDTAFNYGVGLIPTFLVTTGILGILAWLAFLGLFVYLGIRALFSRVKDRFSLYLMVSSFFIALYLWIIHILYVPSLVTLSMAFIFTGLFLASLFREGILGEKRIHYVQDSRKGFAVILLLVLVIIGILTWGYFISNKIMASVYANKGVIAVNNNNITAAETDMLRAGSLDRNPIYYRLLAQVELTRLNDLLSQNNLTANLIQTQFQSILSNAVSAATVSTQLDPTDYRNWMALGSVYQSVVPLGVKDADTSAESAYQEALKRDPRDPDIYLALAQLEVARRNADKAKENIVSALKLKNNDLQAIYLLAQIQLAQNDSNGAVQTMLAATTVAPNNASVYYQLGLLEYGLGNYADAVTVFNQAVALIPNYADARYYLGLSFYKTGQTADAINQFQYLADNNPDNSVVTAILANLKAGRDPFSGLNTSNANQPSQSASSTKKTAQ
ncbi:MAG TPA: tetratricopeptide repeat protein [Candidatus Paceibacterota bacterium]|nr:tetratricopeptide repeat protein [Candidatus Paceibacterota bacterium]